MGAVFESPRLSFRLALGHRLTAFSYWKATYAFGPNSTSRHFNLSSSFMVLDHTSDRYIEALPPMIQHRGWCTRSLCSSVTAYHRALFAEGIHDSRSESMRKDDDVAM